jgi:hypothetical protein
MSPLVPKFLGTVREEDPLADGEGEQAKDERVESGNDEEKKLIFPAPLMLVRTHPGKLNPV